MEGDAELQDLYREVLLDYFRSTTRKGKVDPADMRAHGINPVCGDELEITAELKDGKINKLRYAGHGCVISQASAAMMAEAIEGTDITKAKALIGAFKKLMLENGDVKSLPPELEQLASLEGGSRSPFAVADALLARSVDLLTRADS